MQSVKFVMASLLIFLASCTQTPTQPAPVPSTNSDADVLTEHQATSSVDDETPLVENSPLRRDWSPSELDAEPDLWQRMRDQMYLRIPEKASIKRERQFYGKQTKFWRDTVTRAEPILYHIVRKLEQRKMPVELALLPIVESGYNPAAQGNGPAGLWQLVPGTARNFGLKVTPRYDGRKDALDSTDATLDYLQHLYDTLGHDWLNAVAAYNTGEGRIQAAILRNQNRGKPIDFWSLNIPERYIRTVPKWLAVIQLVRQPEKYSLQLPALSNKPSTVLTTIRPQVSLSQTAKISGVALSELKQLNPAFRTDVTPSGNTWPLLLPASAFERYQQNQQSLTKTIDVTPIPEKSTKTVASIQYKVKSGDTLGSIAKKFKVPTKSIRTSNKLKTDALKLGQVLVIARTGKASDAAKAQDGKAASGKAANKKTKGKYVVQSGDSLDKIARKFNVTVAQLLAWNQLKKTATLKPGQALTVYASK